MRSLPHTGTAAAASTRQALAYFTLAVAGFSFWFLIGAPFASHRESYNWLAIVWRGELLQLVRDAKRNNVAPACAIRRMARVFGVESKYLPNEYLSAGTASSRCVPDVCALLGYHPFFVASAEDSRGHRFRCRRCLLGGYIHLFHIYGVFYAPVLLMIGIMVRLQMSGNLGKYETSLALIAIALTLWHPFATAVFLGILFRLLPDDVHVSGSAATSEGLGHFAAGYGISPDLAGHEPKSPTNFQPAGFHHKLSYE